MNYIVAIKFMLLLFKTYWGIGNYCMLSYSLKNNGSRIIFFYKLQISFTSPQTASKCNADM